MIKLSNILNEATTSDIIKDLDKVKTDLLKKVDALIAKKKKLYSNIDIESPMTADEKKLNKDIADIFSQIQQLIQQKRSIKEDLRKWFGKGKTGSTTGGGWDRYNSKGEKVGKCGDSKEGSAYAACLSKEKAAKLGPDGRASFVNRKRSAQSKAGDSKKGGEQKKGQKPTLVKTGASEGLDEKWSAKYKKSINCSNPKGFSQKAHCAGKKKNEAYDHTAPNVRDNPTIIPKNYIAKLPNNKTKLDAYLLKDGPYFIVQVIGRKTKQQIDAVRATSSKNILNYLTKKGYDLQPLRDAGILKSKNENTMKLTVEQKMELFLEKNVPTDPAKWSASKAAAKKKFDVYPSAYANGWAAKNYKAKGGGWKTAK